jgi:hypothetical protein
MGLEMLGEIRDPVGQYRNLNLRGAGIGLVLPVLFDQLALGFLQ